MQKPTVIVYSVFDADGLAGFICGRSMAQTYATKIEYKPSKPQWTCYVNNKLVIDSWNYRYTEKETLRFIVENANG